MSAFYLTRPEVDQLIRDRPVCPGCRGALDQVAADRHGAYVNAVVLVEGEPIHAGDVVTGLTACGLSRPAARWLVATRRPTASPALGP